MVECVQCGMCCKKAPCPFGYWLEQQKRCFYLSEDEVTEDYTTYKCELYRLILIMPGSKFSPAFGYGCSSSLFNADRIKILQHKVF